MNILFRMDAGKYDAFQARGLQKKLELLALLDSPVNQSVERKCYSCADSLLRKVGSG